jgi:hypothetical protein
MVTCWPCMWPQPMTILRVPTYPCPCSCLEALIATVSQEALGQMQHVHISRTALMPSFGPQQAHSNNFVCSLRAKKHFLYLCKRSFHTPWMPQGPMGHARQLKCNTMSWPQKTLTCPQKMHTNKRQSLTALALSTC